MARKTAKPTDKPPGRPGPKPTGRKPTVLTMKGNEEWGTWLERGAKFCRTDVSKLVDIAVAEYLRGRGFTEEPPER